MENFILHLSKNPLNLKSEIIYIFSIYNKIHFDYNDKNILDYMNVINTLICFIKIPIKSEDRLPNDWPLLPLIKNILLLLFLLRTILGPLRSVYEYSSRKPVIPTYKELIIFSNWYFSNYMSNNLSVCSYILFSTIFD